MTTYQVDPDMERWGLHLIDVCCLTNDGSQQSVTCFEKDLSRTEYVNEEFYNPTHSFVKIEQEVLPRFAAADISGIMSDGHEDERKEGHAFSNVPESLREVEGQYSYPEIEDESGLDGEMGKRLNQLVPVPHVPKVNGEIPSDDEVTSDHQRLLNRLQLYDLEELKILGDGNCQFRSLSDQIYRTPDHHKFVREEVVSQQSAEVTTRVVSILCSHGI